LKVRHEQQETDRLAAGVEFWEDWGLVFTTGFGTPLSPRNDYREFRRLVAAAGLRRVRLHDLRHTAASLMLAQGVNPRVVMEILGHSQIGVTMNTYSHVTPASSREAVARVEACCSRFTLELE
jgi:integrase